LSANSLEELGRVLPPMAKMRTAGEVLTLLRWVEYSGR
jgi:hypothetical protein